MIVENDADIIAFAGQSNADRHFYNPDSSAGVIDGADAFVDRADAIAGVGISAINVSIPGSGSNQGSNNQAYWWDSVNDAPGPALLQAVANIQAALAPGQDLDGIVWAQGEIDAVSMFTFSFPDPVLEDFISSTTSIFEYFRSVFGDDLPIYVQEIGDFPVPANALPGAPNGWDAIRQAQQDIIDADPQTFLAASSGTLLIEDDGIHFNEDQYAPLAKDLADFILEDLLDDDIIWGTNAFDVLRGTSGDDIILGLDGGDRVIGSTGNDLIRLSDPETSRINYTGDLEDFTFTRNSDGSVTIEKPSGDVDTAYGVDTLRFSGDGQVYGIDDLAGPVSIQGTAGDDQLVGTPYDDIVDGLGGSDTAFGSGGDDVITLSTTDYGQVNYEGASTDYAFVLNPDDTITVTKPDGGIDTLTGVDGFYFIGEGAWFPASALVVSTGGTIEGTSGDDILFGTDSNDTIIGNGGSDTIIGSAGNDDITLSANDYGQVNYEGAADDYLFTLNADDTITVIKPDGGVDTLTGVDGFYFLGEQAWYPAGALAFSADGTIDGTAGDDTLIGTPVDNVINGNGGTDTVIGSAGNDEIILSTNEYAQVNYEGAADDYAFELNADNTITVTKPDGGIDTLTGVDGFYFLGEGAWYPSDALAFSSDGTIEGTSGDDTLIGTPVDNTINGNGGSDVVLGSAGDDVITLSADAYGQINYDGAASDYVFSDNGDGTLSVAKPGGETDTISGVDGIWFLGEAAWYATSALTVPANGTIDGTTGDDTLIGTAGDNVINGNGGSDVVVGSAGDDVITLSEDAYGQVNYVGAASDYVFSQNGDGTISVAKPDGGTDTLTGVDGIWFLDESAWYSADGLV